MACGQQSTDGPKGVKLTFAASTQEVAQLCGDAGLLEDFGCQKPRDFGCELVVLKPRGFDDAPRIQTLGHELWHCFHGPVHD